MRPAFEQDPQLRMDVVAFDAVQYGASLGVEPAGKPPSRHLHAMPLHRRYFRVKPGDMFGAPVVGQFFDAELLEHLPARFWPALLRVEWHDASGHEIGPREHT